MSSVKTLVRSITMLGLSLLISCGSPGRVHPIGGPSNGSGASTHFHPSCNSYYSGSIGSHAFTMSLSKYDTILGGAYMYSGHKTFLTLRGAVGPDGRFRIFEYDRPQGSASLEELATGIFEGAMDGDSLTGIWHGKRPAKSLPFHATRFAPDKRSALTAAVGEHRLKNVGVSVGANGMYGYFVENGKWTGGGSSISGGQRVGESSSFKKAELHLLNSLKILVRPNLDLDIVANGVTLLHVPFNPMGMYYASGPFDERATLTTDSVYEPSRTFYNDKLALAYLDSADFSAVLGPLVDNLYINVADHMRLDYRPMENEFDLSLGHNYFDYSELAFRSQRVAK